jgi:ATP-binding cassette subfamily F protein 3
LHGLGFSAETHSRAVSEFSGGWRARLNLARALMMPSDLLLLDEPTNHLDLDAVLWLEQWLLKYPGTLLLISHDREFLDGVSTHILHLHDGGARLYSGDYTRFEHQRAEHLHQQQIAFQKEQAERAHLQAFIARFKAKASKATQAQSRMKRLAKLAGTEAVRAERALSIDFLAPAKLPHALIRLNHVDAGYGAMRILGNVGFGLESGDRIGLLGPNGAGKSTLVKTLLGELPLLGGERSAHPDLVIGYFAQHTVESLHAGQSPVDHLRELAPNESTQSFRDFLGRWNFPGDRAFESVEGFSGGERARLALALIAWRKPNVLLLDEPTNHLDLDMREALAEALSDFPGAIVLVSHDRHLIGLVCDTFWRVAAGRVQEFDGDLDEYAAWLRSRPGQQPSPDRDGQGATANSPRAVSRKPHKANPQRVVRAERRVADLQTRLDAIEVQLADPALHAKDAAQVAVLDTRHRELRAKLENAEAELLELYAADAA